MENEPKLNTKKEEIETNEFTEEVGNLAKKYKEIEKLINNYTSPENEITQQKNAWGKQCEEVIKKIEARYQEQEKRTPLINKQLDYLKAGLGKLNLYSEYEFGMTQEGMDEHFSLLGPEYK